MASFKVAYKDSQGSRLSRVWGKHRGNILPPSHLMAKKCSRKSPGLGMGLVSDQTLIPGLLGCPGLQLYVHPASTCIHSSELCSLGWWPKIPASGPPSANRKLTKPQGAACRLPYDLGPTCQAITKPTRDFIPVFINCSTDDSWVYVPSVPSRASPGPGGKWVGAHWVNKWNDKWNMQEYFESYKEVESQM